MKPAPSAIVPMMVVTDFLTTPAFVDRTYGEPLFHTDSPVAALQYAADDTLWSVEESGVLRQWGDDGHLLARAFLSDLETLWAFSSDATLLASGSDDLVLWSVAEGRELRRINCTSWITKILFSADGSTVVTGHDDGHIRFWYTADLQPVLELAAHPEPISALSFSPDGSQIATAAEDRRISIWDIANRREIVSFEGHHDRIPALAWHPTENLLVSAGWDTTARVWVPPANEPLMLLNKHSEQVQMVAFSNDGRYLACADSDFTIRIWDDIRIGHDTRTLQGHTDEITCLAFSLRGHRLASAGADQVVHVWDLDQGQLVAGPNPLARHRLALCSSPESLLFTTGRGGIHSWKTEDGKPGWVPPVTGSVESIAVSPDGTRLAISNATHVVSVWNIPEQKLESTLNHTRGPISSLTFSPDSQLLAAASVSDGLAWVWKKDVVEAVLVIPEAADGSTLESIAFHPNGKIMAVGGMDWLSTGDSDGAVSLWDLEKRELIEAFGDGVTAIAFDPTGKFLAGGSLRQTLIVWDFAEQKKIFDLPGHQDRIGAVCFSPDGNWLTSAGDDGTLRVWNLLTGRMLVACQLESAIQALTFSPDGRYLYTGNGNTTCSRIEFQRLLEE